MLHSSSFAWAFAAAASTLQLAAALLAWRRLAATTRLAATLLAAALATLALQTAITAWTLFGGTDTAATPMAGPIGLLVGAAMCAGVTLLRPGTASGGTAGEPRRESSSPPGDEWLRRLTELERHRHDAEIQLELNALLQACDSAGDAGRVVERLAPITSR